MSDASERVQAQQAQLEVAAIVLEAMAKVSGPCNAGGTYAMAAKEVRAQARALDRRIIDLIKSQGIG